MAATGLFFAMLAAPAALACDIATPPEVRFVPAKEKPPRVAGWQFYAFTQKSMVDGWLAYRHVKTNGAPAAAAEQKLVQQHAGRAVTAIYGGKSPVVTIEKVQTVRLTFQGETSTARQYNVAVKRNKADAIAAYAGVIVKANRIRRDVAVIVAAIDPDSPDGDLDRPLVAARKLAAHPGLDCAPGDSP